MTDLTKLKELAERSHPESEWFLLENLDHPNIDKPAAAFISAANPKAILGLIAEIAGIKAEAEFWNAAAVSHLQEVDRLKAENAALRSALTELRSKTASPYFLSKIDAALEGGGR